MQGRSGIHTRQTIWASWSLYNARLRGLSTPTTADTPASPGWWITLAGELYKRGVLSAGWAYLSRSPSSNCLHHTTVHCNNTTKNQDQSQPPIHPSTSSHRCLQVQFLPSMCSNMEHLCRPPLSKRTLNNSFRAENMYMDPPRDTQQRPRLGSTGCIAALGPMY